MGGKIVREVLVSLPAPYTLGLERHSQARVAQGDLNGDHLSQEKVMWYVTSVFIAKRSHDLSGGTVFSSAATLTQSERQRDSLSPGVQGHPGEHSGTLSPKQRS